MTRRLVFLFAAIALLLVGAPQASAQETYPPPGPDTGAGQLEPTAPVAAPAPATAPRAAAPTGALPRTGSDLNAVPIGAALVLAGAAGVVLARRRAQAPAFA
jgi:LPXTG-motif cell wall-anchored protein